MIYKQSFYDDFKCVCDKCTFTCCSGWDINVDDKTFKNWKSKHKNLCKFVIENYLDDGFIINKDTQENCVFLKKGLCQIVMDFGEEFLSDTCHNFPRVINDVFDKKEFSLGCTCIEAGILTAENECTYDKNLYMPKRNNALEIIKKHNNIEDAFFEILGKKVTKTSQYLKIERNELFLDVIENYKNVDIYKTFIGIKFKNFYSESDFIKAWNKNMIYIKRLFSSKIFSFCCDEQNFEKDFNLIILEYILIRHSIFVFLKDFDYRNIVEYTAVFSRIIGSNSDAVYEFFGDDFDLKGYLLNILVF